MNKNYLNILFFNLSKIIFLISRKLKILKNPMDYKLTITSIDYDECNKLKIIMWNKNGYNRFNIARAIHNTLNYNDVFYITNNLIFNTMPEAEVNSVLNYNWSNCFITEFHPAIFFDFNLSFPHYNKNIINYIKDKKVLDDSIYLIIYLSKS